VAAVFKKQLKRFSEVFDQSSQAAPYLSLK